jgi:hypothetical protein
MGKCRRVDIVPGHASILLASSCFPVVRTRYKQRLQRRLARPRADSDVSAHEMVYALQVVSRRHFLLQPGSHYDKDAFHVLAIRSTHVWSNRTHLCSRLIQPARRLPLPGDSHAYKSSRGWIASGLAKPIPIYFSVDPGSITSARAGSPLSVGI